MTENAPIRTNTLRRSRTDRMVGGVCGGAAQALGVDAAILRIGLVAATVLGFGAGAVIYLACWLLVPEEEIA
jgi:phage shock protein PspC (stress-responsive transcriptional regulator)